MQMNLNGRASGYEYDRQEAVNASENVHDDARLHVRDDGHGRVHARAPLNVSANEIENGSGHLHANAALLNLSVYVYEKQTAKVNANESAYSTKESLGSRQNENANGRVESLV